MSHRARDLLNRSADTRGERAPILHEQRGAFGLMLHFTYCQQKRCSPPLGGAPSSLGRSSRRRAAQTRPRTLAALGLGKPEPFRRAGQHAQQARTGTEVIAKSRFDAQAVPGPQFDLEEVRAN